MDNQKPNMTRSQYRKTHQPFYKKTPFIVTLIVIILAVIAGIVFWSVSNSHKDEPKQSSDNVENVQSNKSAENNSTDPAESQNVTKDDNKSDGQKTEKKRTYDNPGSYNHLDYKSDDFEFKISNDVRLVKDANGDSALLVKYTYTNKTDSNQVPQKVQAENMILKQGDQVLAPTGGDGDYSETVNKSNLNEVKPGESFEGALLVKVNDPNADVNMYFKNIETKQDLNTMQPFKLS
ncbi:DUF5067 domain-containing protein [Companilactobacillus zhongbaensis]|uniref:DUF5067 domain-containing protein n=1 Tax=Companilactobacillus zhongbaensis TaxID=2486009 RepID=UPI000F7701FA|nr:DUF5067 domain-containing protein [Companilactobacillus zhongbaensis]